MVAARFYWLVQTSTATIHLNADSVEVTDAGSLVFWKEDEAGNKVFQILGLSSGEWDYFHAASCIDGGYLDKYIEHWVAREKV